ncbi:MAG: PglZ domain-containing protein [Betaproteobacteria bacterium]|nr:PglZ domain-containing protein [Betaproteobacteria bacterium]
MTTHQNGLSQNALRLQKRLLAENRWKAELDPMLGALPSYTQLGMASLLPNRVLEIADNDTSAVIVDGRIEGMSASAIM